MTARRLATLVASIAIVPIMLAGCSSSDDKDSSASTTTAPESAGTTEAPVDEVLQILVTNDDGVTSEGISTVAEALAALPNTEVTVVAPATQQSGQGGKETGGTLTAQPATTVAGREATAVVGFPADSVIYALDQGGIDFTPDLVVSGINQGQNIGPSVDISGTVGAARAAAARGIPAIATSSGSNAYDYAAGVPFITDWVEEHRDGLVSGEFSTGEVLLQNMNIPSCAAGTEIRGLLEVPIATSDQGIFQEQDCASTLTDPADDVIAFNNGYVSLSDLPLKPATTTTTATP